MSISSLDHVNIRTSQLEASLAFYVDVLGMTAEPVPGMQDMTHGAWIKAGDGRAAIHLNRAQPGPDFLGDDRNWAEIAGSGRVHHVAFTCTDFDGFQQRLADAGVPIKLNIVDSVKLKQIFVEDPNGVLLELNFHGS